MEYKTLNNGVRMPMVGIGVYGIPKRETRRVVEDAFSVGYRHVDTAAMYSNEEEVGLAVRHSGLPREEVFVATKICEPCYTVPETVRSVERSVKRLGLDFVDLMLIHWPVGRPGVMWKALEELYGDGLFRAVGVSNFYPDTFREIAAVAEVMPVVDQCETHVFYQQRGMLEYLKPRGVALEAWSPLAEGKLGIFRNPVLEAVGNRYGKSAAQVALKFLVQQGIAVIPKTVHVERMRQNIDLFDFSLSDEDLKAVRRLDTGHNVTGWPADALAYEVGG